MKTFIPTFIRRCSISLSVLFLALPAMGAEYMGVETVWKAKSDLTPTTSESPKAEEGSTTFNIGDDVIVLTRNLDGWLNRQIDNGYFSQEKFVTEYWSTYRDFIQKDSSWDKMISFTEGKTVDASEEVLAIRTALADRLKKTTTGKDARTLLTEARGAYNKFLRTKLHALRPMIDNVRFDDLKPLAVEFISDSDTRFPSYLAKGATANDTIYIITYHLARDEHSIDTWQQLLREFKFTPPVGITLTLNTGEENWINLPSKITGEKITGKEPVKIQFVDGKRFFVAVLIIFTALALFVKLVGPTDLVRDTEVAMRPSDNAGNEAHPVSLGRSQMAFWFFLVASAYLFIWLTTTRLDSLNEKILGLVGISSATALGAVFVTTGKAPSRTIAEEQARALDLTLPAADRESSSRRARRLLDQQARLKTCSPFLRLMDDWLTEDGAVSFHRFQMLAWTLVLGFIFILQVCSTYAMPEFSNTILALMGISSGTYLGFKIPDAR